VRPPGTGFIPKGYTGANWLGIRVKEEGKTAYVDNRNWNQKKGGGKLTEIKN